MIVGLFHCDRRSLFLPRRQQLAHPGQGCWKVSFRLLVGLFQWRSCRHDEAALQRRLGFFFVDTGMNLNTHTSTRENLVVPCVSSVYFSGHRVQSLVTVDIGLGLNHCQPWPIRFFPGRYSAYAHTHAHTHPLGLL